MTQFPTTRWDELARASLHGDTAARKALDEFCRRYWAPVNGFIRRKGYDEADAADLTQEFFLNFLETRSWRRADRLRGSFRTFLLGALSHRLQKAHVREGRLKRGGGAVQVNLEDAERDESESAEFPVVPPMDAAHFDRAWAVRMVTAAIARTREDYAAADKQHLYDGLKPFITIRRQYPPYEEAAKALGLSLAAVKTEIHRLRQTFRAALRIEVAQTVSAPHETDAELRHLREVLSRRDNDGESPAET
jgi:DNA-directed RNA polymerase specialized sigma24 family protein